MKMFSHRYTKNMAWAQKTLLSSRLLHIRWSWPYAHQETKRVFRLDYTYEKIR